MTNALTVGCWPGERFELNSFTGIFCRSLRAAGCRVIDVTHPNRVSEPIDVLHVHWPEEIFWGRPGALRSMVKVWRTLRALKRLRRRGVAIVWMVHNLHPHELSRTNTLLWRWLSKGVAETASGYMTLCPATIEPVRDAFPGLAGKPVAYAWHPRYPHAVGSDLRDEARRRLAIGVDVRLFTYLGLIRPYKGVDQLISNFRQSAPASARLLIAGKCDGPEAIDRLNELIDGDPRIIFRPGWLGDAEFNEWLQASDAVVLPYRDYLHSGAMIHALSLDRPIICPAAPFSEALAALVGPEWVSTYREPMPDDLFCANPVKAGKPDLSALEPKRIGEAALSLYRQLAS